MGMRVVVFLNARAGRASRHSYDDRFAEIARLFDIADVVAVVQPLPVQPALLGHLIRRAIVGGVDAVVAAGGDGTVSAVASTLAGGQIPLGVLPLGTMNHFA